MNRFIVISLCFFALAGCGKAKISSSCTLNGRGDAECTFKNSGTAKGSTCEYIALQPKTGQDVTWFWAMGRPQIKALDETYRVNKKKTLKSVSIDEQIDFTVIALINDEHQIVSNKEVCSGLVEAGDIREIKSFVTFYSDDMSPASLCKMAGKSWSDSCDFTMVPKEQVVSLINEKLK